MYFNIGVPMFRIAVFPPDYIELLLAVLFSLMAISVLWIIGYREREKYRKSIGLRFRFVSFGVLIPSMSLLTPGLESAEAYVFFSLFALSAASYLLGIIMSFFEFFSQST
jgi:hypothetical protein